MFGHQSCNQAVITHHLTTDNISQMRCSLVPIPSMKYNVAMIHSGQAQTRQEQPGLGQPMRRLSEADRPIRGQSTPGLSGVRDDVQRQCHGAGGCGPINVGHREAASSILTTFRHDDRVSSSNLLLASGMFLFLSLDLTSGWGCCDELMTRKKQN